MNLKKEIETIFTFYAEKKRLDEDPKYPFDILQEDDSRSPVPSELQYSASEGKFTPVDH